MTKEKFKKVIDVIGLPRLIVSCFFLSIVITAAVCGIDVASFFSSTLLYWGMWVVLVLELLAKMNREQGMTIIMVSSELNELRSLCDRIAIISDGKLAGIFAPDASDAEYGLAMSGAAN